MALTSLIRQVEVLDTSVTTGAGLTGKVYSDFTAACCVDGGTLVSLTTETITTLGTYQAPTSSAHIRIKELNSADPTKGMYEVHFHNTQLATGTKLWLYLSVTGGKAQRLELDLVDVKPVNMTQIGGNAQSATDLKDFADTGYDPASHKVGGVVLVDTTTTNSDMRGTDSAALATDMAKVPKSDGTVSFNATAVAGIQNGLATPTNITAGVITTVTNLTNAPTNGDFTATMKTSITTAATSATPSVTVSDKTGFSLSSAGVQAIWDALTSALTTVGSVGKLIVDNLNATISSRLASASYTAPLDAAGTRTAVGLASANLDTQLAAIPTDADVQTAAAAALTAYDPPTRTEATSDKDAILTRLGTPADTDIATDIAALPTAAEVFTAVVTTALTEAYAADGAAPTLSQALFLIQQHLTEFAISGTTWTTKRLDGSTAAATFTLDDGTNPTSITRAT